MSALIALQTILAVLLVAAILLQSRGSGLGSTFGGGESYVTRRGVEKLFFKATVLIAFLFLFISLVIIVA